MIVETTEQKETLLQALRQAASNLSYYNAAEGSAYTSELIPRTEAREKYNAALHACVLEGINIDVEFDKSRYLL